MVPLIESNQRVLGGRLDAFGKSQSISFGELPNRFKPLGIERAFGTAKRQIGRIENGSPK
jgi:hypothetical protein